MLYIHKLSDLNVKSAEIESIQVVRSIRQHESSPTQENLGSHLAGNFITEADVSVIEQAISLLQPTTARLNELLLSKNPVHESVNIVRSIQGLAQVSNNLSNSLNYARDMMSLQQGIVSGVAAVLNSVPFLRTAAEKSEANAALSRYFELILRSKDLSFNYREIISEGHTLLIRDLLESFRNGYLFHFTLEDEIKKANFDAIKPRIPARFLDESGQLASNIDVIKDGVDRAYDINLRMISQSIVLFSFIKWLMAK